MHTKAEADELRRNSPTPTPTSTPRSRGAAAAVERAVGLSDTLIERVRELIRDFQGKTVALSRTDADYFMKLLRLQAWFLENLERRLGVGREKMLGVYEDVLQSHAPPARAAAAARSPAQTISPPRCAPAPALRRRTAAAGATPTARRRSECE